ncbi:hypothetical protein [Zhaonella formicivorans]|uniref:hypothetical protein n=1 Tax=Zhaonella formicivorans TaxID=2528593 RepID=UPI0010E5D260|nr:hypothetical protein [Zhaonella formicivorans]
MSQLAKEVYADDDERISEAAKKTGPSLAGLGLIALCALGLYYLLTTLPTGSGWMTYGELAEKAPTQLLYKLYWFLGDTNEAQFYKSALGGVAMIGFAALAWFLDTQKSRWAGFSIAYGSGIWPWVLASQTLGLIFSVFVFRFLEVLGTTDLGWVPTFVPFVSIPVAVLFVYGPSLATVFTGAVLGALLGFPIAYWVDIFLLVPWKLPLVVGNVTSMWLGGIITLEICRYLPWIKRVEPKAPESPAPKENLSSASWFVRRVLADFTEPQFYANELASIGLLLGTIVSWFLTPESTVYGGKMLPALLAGQLLTSALGVYLYHKHWEEKGWYPTFVPIVSITPAVILAYGGTLQSILIGAILGALIGPPLGDMVNRKLPEGWHPLIGNTFAMSLGIVIVMMIVNVLPGLGRPW